MPSNESNDPGSKHLRPVNARENQLVAYNPRTINNLQDDETIDIRELWRSVLKRKWVVVAILAIALVSTFLATSLMVPIYRSTATLQVDPTGAKILNYQNFTDSAGGRYGTLSFYKSQLAILRSRGLSESVVRAEGIEDHPELNGEIRQRSVTGELRSMFHTITSAFKPGDQSSTRPLSAEQRRELQIKRAASALRSRLSAKQMPDTNLISVAFDSYSGQFAARVANAVVMEYKRSTMQRRYDAGSEARGFLQEQLGEMRIDLERADQALLDFAEETQVTDLEKRLEMAGDTISELNQRLTEVETELITLQGYKSMVEGGQASDLNLMNENEDIRQLRRERAQLATEYASLSQQFKEGYPALVQLRNKIDTISDQIAEERTLAIRRFLSRYKSLTAEAEALRIEIESREQSILALNQQGVQYNILKRDFETNRELYDGLLQRMKEIGVATGVQENNIAVIDSALPANSPYKPQLGRNLVMALAVGLMVGVGLALVLEFFDSTIQSVEELEAVTGRPALGLVPIVKAKNVRQDNQGFDLPERAVGHYSARFPKSSVSEAFRSLRTSLMFSASDGMPKIILITSPGPGEGKTSTAINLATVMAQNGARVLLIDADLRKPRLHRDFGKSQSPGLTDRIAGSQDEQSEASTISTTDVERLFVMPSGNQAPNPAELLSSDQMAKILAMSSRTFDHVIIDTAPILGLADSIVLSRLVDGVLVVTAAGLTAKESIKISMRRLAQVRAPVLGVVLNSVDFDSPDYAYYSSYYYNYESDDTGDNDPMEERKALESSA